MNILFSCPSKTFLLGEYLALFGGTAIIANTAPRFQLQCSQQKKSLIPSIPGIATQSPAGKFLAAHPSLLKNFHLEFKDPHNKQGGLGASSAQFLFCYALLKFLSTSNFSSMLDLSLEDLLKEYLRFAWDGTGIAPSGYDVISQYLGNMTHLYKKQPENIFYHNTFSWPFPDIDFFLLRTKVKIATHTHLSNLPSLAIDELRDIADSATHAINSQNSNLFIKTINQYSAALKKLNLGMSSTDDLLAHLNNHLELLASKGCGALGADVILIIFQKENFQTINSWLQKENFAIIASKRDVTQGLRIDRQFL